VLIPDGLLSEDSVGDAAGVAEEVAGGGFQRADLVFVGAWSPGHALRVAGGDHVQRQGGEPVLGVERVAAEVAAGDGEHRDPIPAGVVAQPVQVGVDGLGFPAGVGRFSPGVGGSPSAEIKPRRCSTVVWSLGLVSIPM
jgi:hypothetical protein